MAKIKVEAEVKGKTEKIARRDFLGFFLFGGFLSLLPKKITEFAKQDAKKAMFWRKADEA